jgi:hypothetical protein
MSRTNISSIPYILHLPHLVYSSVAFTLCMLRRGHALFAAHHVPFVIICLQSQSYLVLFLGQIDVLDGLECRALTMPHCELLLASAWLCSWIQVVH